MGVMWGGPKIGMGECAVLAKWRRHFAMCFAAIAAANYARQLRLWLNNFDSVSVSVFVSVINTTQRLRLRLWQTATATASSVPHLPPDLFSLYPT